MVLEDELKKHDDPSKKRKVANYSDAWMQEQVDDIRKMPWQEGMVSWSALIEKCPDIIQLVRPGEWRGPMHLLAVHSDPEAIRYLPKHILGPAICEWAVEHDYQLLQEIPHDHQFHDLAISAVAQSPRAHHFLHPNLLTAPVCAMALLRDESFWVKELIPPHFNVELAAQAARVSIESDDYDLGAVIYGLNS
ncbi:hypothetical protein ACQU0X_25950 [Pseudovibrio ascidiaceicola]|uniref:hypothetical protein n=1 Tax=Pseudovibrio ascidiaceicola TaxID=285279 RepID=UPI003D363558